MPTGRRWHGSHHRPEPKAEDDTQMDTEGELVLAPDEIPKPLGIENKSSPLFATVSGLLDNLESKLKKTDVNGVATSRNKIGYKQSLLENWFEKWRKDIGPDLYPVIRLLMPERDNRRSTYNLKEQKLAKAYIVALGLDEKSVPAKRLLSWKVPTPADPGAGEFSTVAYEIIHSRSTYVDRRGLKTVDNVNEVLDQLSKAKTNEGPNGVKRPIGIEHARILKDCTETMTPTEQKWLIRIILKDLKIGLGEKTIFNAMHQDAMEMFNTCSDILRVCWKLTDKDYRLPREDNELKPNSVFRPMLCSRNNRDLGNIVKSMAKGRLKTQKNNGINDIGVDTTDPHYYAPNQFIIEEKLDGERIQLHKVGNSYKYYSRHSKDYTYLYGATPHAGSLTPRIHHLFHDQLEEVILDGEMLAWDPTIDKVVPFGTLKTFAAQESGDFGPDDVRPVFIVFDVLYFKTPTVTKQLISVTLRERKKLLYTAFATEIGAIHIVDFIKGTSVEDISERLKIVLEERGEGLVVKNPESFYILGGREETWVKIKPDYMDQLGETIDALVIGAYWGQGNRGGRHASFMVGLRDDSKPLTANGQPHFVSFAKVGGGFNLQAFDWIRKKTNGKWHDLQRTGRRVNTPAWMHTSGTNLDEIPDQVIEPCNSFVVKIKASEIIKGDDYGARLTLRFPRAVIIREEMTYEDAATIEDIKHMRGAGNKRQMGDDIDLRGKHKKKAKTIKTQAHTVSARIVVVEASKMFAGLTFYVHILKHPETNKDKLQADIIAHGGSIIQKIPEASDSRVVVATEYKGGITRLKGAATADIVNPDWVLNSIAAKRKLALTSNYYVQAMDDTKALDIYNSPPEDLTPLPGAEDPQPDEEANPSAAPSPDSADSDSDAEMAPIASTSLLTPREVKTEEEENDYYNLGGGSAAEDEYPTEDEDESDQEEAKPKLESPEVGHTRERVEAMELERSPQPVAPGIGEDTTANTFDETKLFDQFLFYFDTEENAVAMGLELGVVGEKVKTGAENKLAKAREELLSKAGLITTNLFDPKLTHIVVTKLIKNRYKELVRRTSEPRYRKLVTSDWIMDCVGLEEIIDEGDYGV